MGGTHSRLTRLHYSIIPLLLITCVAIAFADTSSAATKIWEEVSGENAFAHVQRLVDFGPRPSGSEAIEKSRHYIEDQLRRSGWQVTRQAFTDDTPRGKVQFVNLIAKFFGHRRLVRKSLFCERTPRKQRQTIPRGNLVRHGWRSFPRRHAPCRFASR